MGKGLIHGDCSEAYRHRCEVWELLRLGAAKGHLAVDAQILRIEEKRGAESANRLRADYKTQWRAGNRGTHGDWRELGLNHAKS